MIQPSQSGPLPKRCPPCKAKAQQIRSKEWQEANRERVNIKSSNWRKKNLEKARASTRRSMEKQRLEDPRSVKDAKLRSTYQLTDEDIESLIKKAAGHCELCDVTFGNTSGERQVIDHDHKTGKVRGLLCGNCNTGIGFAKDSEDVLNRLAEYLDNPPGIPT